LVNTAYAGPIVALVSDSGGNPVPGAVVTFTPPATGASVSFAGGVNTAVSNAQGLATSAAMTANTVSAWFSVVAVSGSATTTFSLDNTPGVGTQVIATSGSGQSTPTNTAFAKPLVATVQDAFGNA